MTSIISLSKLSCIALIGFITVGCSHQETTDNESTETQTEESSESKDISIATMSEDQTEVFDVILSSLQDSSLLLHQTKQADLPSAFYKYEDDSEYDGHTYTLQNGEVNVKYSFYTNEDSALTSIQITANFPNHESMKETYDNLRNSYENVLGEAKSTRDRDDEKSYFKKWKIGEDNLFFQTDEGASNFLFRYTRY